MILLEDGNGSLENQHAQIVAALASAAATWDAWAVEARVHEAAPPPRKRKSTGKNKTTRKARA